MTSQILATLAMCILLTACGGSGEPVAPASLVVRVDASGVSDTVGARPATINVNVTQGGTPSAGVTVRFAVVPDPVWPEPPLTIVGTSNAMEVTRTTSAQGTATADVQFGKRAGAFAVAVSVGGVARPDTVRITLKAGKPAVIRVVTPDTLATVGVLYHPAISVTDWFGNASSEPVTLQTTAPCLIDGTSIVRTTTGRCAVDARVGTLATSLVVTFVPMVRIVGVLGNKLYSMNLDGSGYKAIRTLRGGQIVGEQMHPVRAANGLVAVMDVGTDQKTHIYVVDSTGATSTPIPVSTPVGSEQNWPRFSPDGQFVYSSNCNYPAGEACRVWRSRVDGSSSVALTPSKSSNGFRSNKPDITPDGKFLVYCDEYLRMRVLDLASRADRPLGGRQQVNDLSIDPTGTRVAFLDINTGVLGIINLDGTGLGTVPRNNAFWDTVAWTPDGAWIISSPRAARPDGATFTPWTALVSVSTGEVIWLPYKNPAQDFTVER